MLCPANNGDAADDTPPTNACQVATCDGMGMCGLRWLTVGGWYNTA